MTDPRLIGHLKVVHKMAEVSSSYRDIQVREILLGLRDLQHRLDELVSAADPVLEEAGTIPSASAPLILDVEPAVFLRPWTQPVVQQPARGTLLGGGARFYAGNHQGWILVTQRPANGLRAGCFEVGINFREFDGEWMSLVFDLRESLRVGSAGRARLLISAQVGTFPRASVQFKCGWRHAGQEPQARQTAALDGEALHGQLDLDWLRPQDLEALELHVIFPVSGRGAIYVRSLQATLLFLAEAGSQADVEPGVFEDAP